MNGIIKYPKKSLSSKQKKVVNDIASDLKKIKKTLPTLDEIVIRGGFIPDLLLNKEPKDIDLFYCIKDKKNHYSTNCKCKIIRAEIDKLDLKLIGKKYQYDLENSFEKEPRLKPIERTVSFFSYHSDWLSMFCLDANGNIWTNKTTLKFFKKNTHEVRYAGFLPWLYWPRPTDNSNYYASLATEIIRGLAHIKRRNLKIGPEFTELLDNAPFILKTLAETDDKQKVLNIIEHKFGSMSNLTRELSKLNIVNKAKIIEGFALLETKKL